MDYREVYAVPGSHTIVDAIHPETGLTQAFGQTEAEVIARVPGAVRMTWETFQASQIARQQTPITWQATTEDVYNERLDVLPPIMLGSGAFLVSEPCDHCHATGRPRYEAYWHRGAAYLVSSRPMTIPELRAIVQAAR